MRDLYSRLGIKENASEQEILNALSNCRNSTLKEDASTVLLTPTRRKDYDQVRLALKDIGNLRAHLGLNYSDNWRSPESDDFSTVPTHEPSLHDQLIRKAGQSGKREKPKKKRETINEAIKRQKRTKIVSLTKELFQNTVRLAAILGSFVFIIWILSTLEDRSKSPSAPKTSHSGPQTQPFSGQPLPLPETGTIRNHSRAGRVAPFEIKTSSGVHYLIKLEDTSTGRNALDVFVRGGSTVTIKVPLGAYRLKYATGQSWYGYTHYFGTSTNYNKADSTFYFYNDGDSVTGYTVTLYQVQNGNLRTSRLSPDKF